MLSRIFSRSPRSTAPATGKRNMLGLLWALVRQHWFTLALALIVALALWRRRPPTVPAELVPMTPVKEAPERFTQQSADAAPQAASLVDAPKEPTATAGVRLPALDDATTVAFLQRFARTAVAEQERFGMPASVLLACAYVNSFAGKRNCATEANNYVAMRCTADWAGAVHTLDGICYRLYNTAWESLRDFNVYYSRKAWYAELKKNAGRDWKKWLKELAARGVSDVANFEAEATRLIATFRVYELDEPAPTQ